MIHIYTRGLEKPQYKRQRVRSLKKCRRVEEFLQSMGCSSSQVSLPPEPLRSKDGGSDLRTTDIVDWDFLQEKMEQNKEGARKSPGVDSTKMSNSDNVLPQKRESEDKKHIENFKVIKQDDKSQRKPKSKQRLNTTQMTLQEVDEIE